MFSAFSIPFLKIFINYITAKRSKKVDCKGVELYIAQLFIFYECLSFSLL